MFFPFVSLAKIQVQLFLLIYLGTFSKHPLNHRKHFYSNLFFCLCSFWDFSLQTFRLSRINVRHVNVFCFLIETVKIQCNISSVTLCSKLDCHSKRNLLDPGALLHQTPAGSHRGVCQSFRNGSVLSLTHVWLFTTESVWNSGLGFLDFLQINLWWSFARSNNTTWTICWTRRDKRTQQHLITSSFHLLVTNWLINIVVIFIFWNKIFFKKWK